MSKKAVKKTDENKDEQSETHDPFQDALFREIEEDLRMEKLAIIWEKYSIYVYGTIFIIIATVAGSQGYEKWRKHIRSVDADKYLVASEALLEGKIETAKLELNELIKSARTDYDLIAQIRLATIKAKEGDTKALYDIASGKTYVPENYRDAATVYAGYYKLEEGKVDEVASSVSHLTDKQNPWRGSALELTALAHIAKGEYLEADKALNSIVKDDYMPQNIKSRASEIKGAIAPEVATMQQARKTQAPTENKEKSEADNADVDAAKNKQTDTQTEEAETPSGENTLTESNETKEK